MFFPTTRVQLWHKRAACFLLIAWGSLASLAAQTESYFEDFNDGQSLLHVPSTHTQYVDGVLRHQDTYVIPAGSSLGTEIGLAVGGWHADFLKPTFSISITVRPQLIDPGDGALYLRLRMVVFRYEAWYSWVSRSGDLSEDPAQNRFGISKPGGGGSWAPAGLATSLEGDITYTLTLSGTFLTSDTARFVFSISDGVNSNSVEQVGDVYWLGDPAVSIRYYLGFSGSAPVTPRIDLDNLRITPAPPVPELSTAALLNFAVVISFGLMRKRRDQ